MQRTLSHVSRVALLSGFKQISSFSSPSALLTNANLHSLGASARLFKKHAADSSIPLSASTTTDAAPNASWQYLLELNGFVHASRDDDASVVNSAECVNAVLDGSRDAWRASVVEWWSKTFSRCTQQTTRVESNPEHGNSMDPLPVEQAEVTVLVQALAATIARLQDDLLALTEMGANGEGLDVNTQRTARRVCREMEAVMVYLVVQRLRSFSPTRSQPADKKTRIEEANPSPSTSATMGTAHPAVHNSSQSSQAPSLSKNVHDRTTLTQLTMQKDCEVGSLSLKRGDKERVRDLAQPYSVSELLEVTVLLETIHAVLAVAERTAAVEGVPMVPSYGKEAAANSTVSVSIMSHETLSVLYGLSVIVLGAVEQISGAALASLATCMAQCAESHAIITALHHLENDSVGCGVVEIVNDHGSSSSTATSPAAYIRPLSDSRCSIHGSGDNTVRDETQESVEQARERRRCQRAFVTGTAVRPIEVVAQVKLLCAAARSRMESELRPALLEHRVASQRSNAGVEREREETISFATLWRQCLPAHAAAAADVLEKRADEAERVRGAHLALASLAARKAADERAKDAPERRSRGGGLGVRGKTDAAPGSAEASRPRRRWTVGDAAAAAAAVELSGKEPSNSAPAATPPCATSEERAALLRVEDVAEMCTAVAVMRDPTDTMFWRAATCFTAAAAYSFVQRLRYAHRGDGCSHGCKRGNEEEEDAAAQVSQLLRSMRDVAFALDRVGRREDYDTLMRVLVRLGLLRHPIPAPSTRMLSMAGAVPPN